MSAGHLTPADALKFCGVRLGAAIVRRAPRASRALIPLAGEVAFRLNARARANVLANLRGLLPEAEDGALQRTARSIFRSVARYYVELLSLPAVGAGAIERRASVQGYEVVPRLLAEGRGVILVGSHTGPGELILQALAARGVTVTAVVERLQPAQVNDFLLRARSSSGHSFVFPDVAGFRALRRTLRAGGMVALLVDRDVLGSGIEVPFCGRRLRAPFGAVELAALTGAPILPATAYWRADGGIAVAMLPPLRFDRSARRGAARVAAIARLLDAFCPHVRAHAEQWLVLEPFWADSAGGRSATLTG